MSIRRTLAMTAGMISVATAASARPGAAVHGMASTPRHPDITPPAEWLPDVAPAWTRTSVPLPSVVGPDRPSPADAPDASGGGAAVSRVAIAAPSTARPDAGPSTPPRPTVAQPPMTQRSQRPALSASQWALIGTGLAVCGAARVIDKKRRDNVLRELVVGTAESGVPGEADRGRQHLEERLGLALTPEQSARFDAMKWGLPGGLQGVLRALERDTPPVPEAEGDISEDDHTRPGQDPPRALQG